MMIRTTFASMTGSTKLKYQTPVPLSVKDYHSIYSGDSFITPKIDGTRRFLILFNGQCFSIDPLGDIRKELLDPGNVSYLKSSYCVLDCEYIPTSGVYNVIDVIYESGRVIGNDADPITRIHTFSKEYMMNHDKVRTKDYRKITKNIDSDVVE